MRNFGRGLRTIAILIVIMLGLTFTVGQLLKNVINYEDTSSVLVFTRDIKKGELIDNDDVDEYIKTIKIPRTDIPKTALTVSDNVVDQYINEDVFQGEFVTNNTLSKDYPFHVSYDIPKGYSLVSVKFDRGDSANAWNVFEGQEVNLVYSPSISTTVTANNSEYLSERLINGKIYSIKDSQFYVQGELEFNPTKLLYITFLVKDNDAILISRIKDKGRIDIIQ